jgi:uncharacterized membrane protein YcaP (DUF421 family)
MEIVLRATIIFFFLWILTRVLGKRTLAQLSTFELVLLIVLGDMIQGSVTQDDTSMTGGMLAVATLAAWVTIFSFASWRFNKVERVIEGVPAVLISDGEVVEETMRIERMPMSDLYEAARQQGIGDLSEVRLAVLEVNGLVSFIREEGGDGEGGDTQGRGPRRRFPQRGSGGS